MADPLGDPFLVNTTTAGLQQEASVAELPNGGFVVSWMDSSETGADTDGGAVRMQMFDASGVPVGGELLVNTTTASSQNYPSVSAVGDDGFVVVWEDNSHSGDDTSSSSIRAQRFDLSGAKVGAEFVVDTLTSGFQLQPQVTGLQDGGYVVTWQDASGFGGDSTPYAVRARVFDALGVATGPDFLVNTTTAGSQVGASVTALEGGGFVITWRDSSGAAVVRGQVYDASGHTVGGELTLSDDTVSDASAAQVTALSGGGFVVVFNADHGDLDISARMFDATGTAIGASFTVNTALSGSQSTQVVASLHDGGFVVAWRDDAANAIKAREFDAAGHPVGDEFTVNTSIGQLPAAPSITVLQDGDFVISWNETSGDGASSNTDVYSRIFHAEGGNVATDGDDVLHGTTDGDTIDGLGGNDVISGLAGDDSLLGSDGDDTLDGGAGDDTLGGGAGRDTVSYASATAAVTVRLAGAGVQHTGGGGSDLLVSIEDVDGSAFRDHLTGSSAANHLEGGAGRDVLAGGGGADLLGGGADADKLNGGAGDDTLDGGAGKDQLTGGAGADVFVFGDGQADGDRINDLEAADLIDLSAIDADVNSAGDQRFKLVDAFSHHAGQAVLAVPHGKDITLLELDTDGDAKADVTIRIAGDHHDFGHFVL